MDRKTLINKIMRVRGLTEDNLKMEKEDVLDWEEMEEIIEEVTEDLILENKDEKVGVLYDVDVDGLFAGYIMENFLERKRINVKRYMNKNKEHGLTEDNIKIFKEDGLDWLFVVDAGSGDGKLIKELDKYGIKVIVLDHHPYEKDDTLGEDINKRILNIYDKPELPKLSGCGVVYRFVERLAQLFNDSVKSYEKYVGITVLSDMCDMLDKENRYYVKEAYKNIRGNRFLKKFTYYGSGKSFYSFGVIPYLNASIRVGEEEKVMDFINSMDSVRKMNKIERDVKRVKEKQQEMVEQIDEKSKIIELDDVVLLLRKDDFDELSSVNGLKCNKLMSEYQKPAIVMNRDEDIWKGSLRSNTFKKDELERYGFKTAGHDFACGLSITNEDIIKFKNNFKYEGKKKKQVVTFSINMGKLKESIWIDLAKFNEFTGFNLESIRVRIKEGVEGSIDVDEVSSKKKEIIFEKGVVTDFTGRKEVDLVVEPLLKGNSYQLIRV